MKYKDLEQGSDEWLALRVGKVGGSEAIGLSTDARTKTMIWEKLAELETGEAEEVRVTPDMERGSDLEPYAIEDYEAETFQSVEKVGYIMNELYPGLGLSPDGIVGLYGAVEVKCPRVKKHIMTILTNEIPKDNKDQCVHYFVMLPKLEWLDFISYCEEYPNKKMHIIRVHRDDYAKEIKKEVVNYYKYQTKIDEYTSRLRNNN